MRLAEAQAKCDLFGLPLDKAATIALIMQEQRQRPLELAAEVIFQPVAEPQHRLEKRLRTEIQAMASRLDYQEGREPGDTNTELLSAGFPKRKTATLDDLQKIRAHLARRLGDRLS